MPACQATALLDILLNDLRDVTMCYIFLLDNLYFTWFTLFTISIFYILIRTYRTCRNAMPLPYCLILTCVDLWWSYRILAYANSTVYWLTLAELCLRNLIIWLWVWSLFLSFDNTILLERLLSEHGFIIPHSSSLLAVLKNHVAKKVMTEFDNSAYIMLIFYFEDKMKEHVGHCSDIRITDQLTNARQWDEAIRSQYYGNRDRTRRSITGMRPLERRRRELLIGLLLPPD